jgi:hypothetical protein
MASAEESILIDTNTAQIHSIDELLARTGHPMRIKLGSSRCCGRPSSAVACAVPGITARNTAPNYLGKVALRSN